MEISINYENIFLILLIYFTITFLSLLYGIFVVIPIEPFSEKDLYFGIVLIILGGIGTGFVIYFTVLILVKIFYPEKNIDIV